MMEVQKNADEWSLVFDQEGADFLRNVFRSMRDAYKTRPSEMNSAIRTVWYSETGHPEDATDEERELWNDSLYDFRCERGRMLERWMEQLQKPAPVTLKANAAEHEALLIIMNDYRLALAAKFEVSEEDMDANILEVSDTQKRFALIQMYFLSAFMTRLLEAI